MDLIIGAIIGTPIGIILTEVFGDKIFFGFKKTIKKTNHYLRNTKMSFTYIRKLNIKEIDSDHLKKVLERKLEDRIRIIGTPKDEIKILNKNGSLSFNTVISIDRNIAEKGRMTSSQLEFRHILEIRYRDIFKNLLNLITKVQEMEASFDDTIEIISEKSSLMCEFNKTLDLDPLLKHLSVEHIYMESDGERKIQMIGNKVIVYGIITDESVRTVKDLFVLT